MKGYTQRGDTLSMTAPYDVASGAGFLVGAIFAVAVAAALSGASVEGDRIGVFTLAKATGQAWTAHTTKLYWDNTNKVLTSTASGNTLVGVAAAAAASGDTTGSVLLTGQIA